MATASSSRGTRRSGRLSSGNRPRTHPSRPSQRIRSPRAKARRKPALKQPLSHTIRSKLETPAKVQRRRAGEDLPDLHAILDAFSDAQALVAVAHIAMEANDQYGPEEHVLRLGVEALDLVYDQIDRAGMQLARFIKTVTVKGTRGAS
jgi:hypothetical protein